MNDRLFSFGVFDDELTPRERAEKPVRCLEDELLPRLAERQKCERCRLNPARAHDTYCASCRRISDGHKRSARVRSAERLVARAKKAGYVDVERVHPDAVAYCIRQKWIRRASVRDMRRLGLNEHASIFLPVSDVE